MNMRMVVVAVVGSFCSACLPTPMPTMVATRRLLVTTAPSVPPSLAGGSGLALGLRTLPLPAQDVTATGGVGYATVQPELSGVVNLGQGTSVSAELALAPTGIGVRAPVGSPPASDSLAAHLLVGAGHDFRLAEGFGLHLSAELGLIIGTLVSDGPTMPPRNLVAIASPSLRAAAGLWKELGPVRLYAGFSGGTTETNTSVGSRTSLCVITCDVTENGVTSTGALVMGGGGVRWQAAELLSIGLEAWAPFFQSGARMPLVTALTFRVGDFTRKPVVRVNAPPPPPFEVPVPPPAPPGV